jgi:hypothetical protein
MSELKILCTGNPNDFTVARSIKELFPTADFASRATGYDLRMWEPTDEDFFKNNIVNYNVLINSSFVSDGAQLKILEITHDLWKDRISWVFNIGSTAEYEGRKSFYPKYSIQKRALKEASLAYCSAKFRTTHITVGGINDNKPGHENWLNTRYIASAIQWVLNNKANVPILGLEQL